MTYDWLPVPATLLCVSLRLFLCSVAFAMLWLIRSRLHALDIWTERYIAILLRYYYNVLSFHMYKYNRVRDIIGVLTPNVMMRFLVLLGNVAVLVEEHDASV